MMTFDDVEARGVIANHLRDTADRIERGEWHVVSLTRTPEYRIMVRHGLYAGEELVGESFTIDVMHRSP